MKKIINKNTILAFVLGILLSTGIVYGALYRAEEISYNSDKSSAKNVSEALDNLYNKNSIGDAETGNILLGKTALVKGGSITGTMPDNGAWTNTPTSSGNVTIPEGYHNGSGYVDTTSVYNAGYNAGKAAPPAYTTKQLSFSFSVGADRSNDYTLDFSPYFSTMVGITNVSFPAGGFSAPSSIGVNTGSKKVSVRVKAIADSSGTVTVTGYGIAK